MEQHSEPEVVHLGRGSLPERPSASLSAPADVEAQPVQKKESQSMSTRFTIIRNKIRQTHQRTRYVTPKEDEHPEGHKNLFKAILYELFVTRSMAPIGDRELYVKYSIRQFFIFVYFLMSLSVVAYANTSPFAYIFQKSLDDLLVEDRIDHRSWHTKTFQSIAFVEDVWTYLEHGLPSNLYLEYFYTSSDYDNANEARAAPQPEDHVIFYENHLVGLPRLRQIRVVRNNCPLADAFKHLNRECYPPYSEDAEDEGDETNYWPILKQENDTLTTFPGYEEAWHYRTADELSSSWHWGDLYMYTGNGAVQNLAKTKAETIEIIVALKDHIWIEKSTRAVFLDFTIYNENVDLFCYVRLAFEFPATGGVTTSHTISPFRILHYESWYEAYVVGPSEVVIGLLSVYYLCQEFLEIRAEGSHDYVRDMWAWLDIFIILSSWAVLSLRVYLAFLIEETFDQLSQKDLETEFHSFEFVEYWQTFYNEALSVCQMLCWFKLFKYIGFNKTMAKLCGTLNRCSQDIAGFAVLFFLVFISFAQLGFLQFGAEMKDFRSFEDCIFTLLRLILGDFDFHGLETASPYVGPIFFVLYIFFIFFVLLNMFLAIMNDTYSEVKAEIQAQRNEFEIADYVFRGFNNFLGIFGRRNTKWDAENAVKLAAADGQLTFDEIRKSLRRADFSDVEIEIFLARYDVNEDHPCLDEEEAQWRLDALQEKHDSAANESNAAKKPEPEMSVGGLSVKVPSFKSGGVLANEDYSLEEKFQELETRVSALEHSLGRLILKIKSIIEVL